MKNGKSEQDEIFSKDPCLNLLIDDFYSAFIKLQLAVFLLPLIISLILSFCVGVVAATPALTLGAIVAGLLSSLLPVAAVFSSSFRSLFFKPPPLKKVIGDPTETPQIYTHK